MPNSTNWSGNLTYSTDHIESPRSLEELQDLVRRSRNIKVLGSRHSFNDIADCPDTLVSLTNLDHLGEPDPASATVQIGGAVNYGQLSMHLHERGWALHNLASLPHISVAGACATATHGSGAKNGNLATAVVGMKIVGVDGELREVTAKDNPDEFYGSVVGLGALGIVVQLTLKIEPAYKIAQWVYEGLPMDTLSDNFEEVYSSGYSVSLFTDWQSPSFNQVWVKKRVGDAAPAVAELFGAQRSEVKLHPLPGLPAVNCTDQCGIPGDWHDRLPHFRMNFTPSAGEELQSEFFVPVDRALEALAAIAAIGKTIAPALFVSEIRFIAADNLWMSPCYERDSVGIHFTWKKDVEKVTALLPLIQQQLRPYKARPHWGKLFTTPREELQELYPRMGDFITLAKARDPNRKFTNRFLDENIYQA